MSNRPNVTGCRFDAWVLKDCSEFLPFSLRLVMATKFSPNVLQFPAIVSSINEQFLLKNIYSYLQFCQSACISFCDNDLRSSLCYVGTLPDSANITTVGNFLFGDLYPKNENPQQICQENYGVNACFPCMFRKSLFCFKNVYYWQDTTAITIKTRAF